MRRKPFLRDYAASALPVVQTIRDHQRALETALAGADREAELQARGPLGEGYRLLGQLDHAAAHLETARALAADLGQPRALVSNTMRLGVARQYAGDHATAEGLLREAVALAEQDGFLLDQTRLALGKCLAELGQWEEALPLFEQVVAGRRVTGTADGLAAAEEALEAARQARP